MASPRPIVLVHGAVHGAWCWAALQTELDRRGVPSYAVDLPGHGGSVEELSDTMGNAAAVSAVVDRVVARHGQPAVLVGHSYGGTVIGQAAEAASVAHLVFLTALVTEVGESPTALMATFPPPQFSGPVPSRIFLRNDDGTISGNPEAAVPVFYNDSPPEAAAAAIARLCPQRGASLKQEVTRAAWKEIPSTYVRCTKDMAISIAAQDMLIGRLPNPAVATLETDHSPFLGMPGALADILAPLATS